MRRTSQSMYQPANNSNLMNSKFNGTLQVSSLAKSGIQHPRKLEGRDFGKTEKSSFQQTVNKLKSKPNQKVLQDQYIKGLQQEIKYLQYQLKLLKDKQILQREGVNELDNFLKDQIPINQNILAMKNKYNATKTTLEQQFQLLSQKKIEATDVLTSQKNQINRLHDIIGAHRKQVAQRNSQFQQKLNEMMRQMTMTQEEYKELSDDNKRKNEQIKRFMESIANTQRSIEKEKVMEVRLMEEKSKGAEKFQEKNRATKENLIQSLQKLQEAKLYAQSNDNKNPLVQQLQQKNSSLRKKIMLNQKQKSTSQNIIAEIQLFLKQEQREREIERKQKAKHTNASQQYRNQIQNLERFSDNMIKEQTLRYKHMLIKQMNHDLKDKEEIYDLFTDRLRNLQTECSGLIQEKKELQDDIQEQIKLQKQKDKQTGSLMQQILQSKCKIRALDKQSIQLQKLLQPVKIELQRIGTQSPMIQKQKQKRLKMIAYLNKKIQLMKELKGLDLQQLHMVSVSGKMVEDKLGTFIKNWERLKLDTQPQN